MMRDKLYRLPMQTLSSHRDVLLALKRPELHHALSAFTGERVTQARVQKWWDRNRIAADWQVRVARYAREAGHPEITPELLDELAPARGAAQRGAA